MLGRYVRVSRDGRKQVPGKSREAGGAVRTRGVFQMFNCVPTLLNGLALPRLFEDGGAQLLSVGGA